MGGVAWTEEEDRSLKKCIDRYGEGKWHLVPLLAGLNRCRKSCRLRWLNYLRPNIKRGSFSEEEVQLIIKLHNHLGNRWSVIAKSLPGRTANDVKNYWNCHLTKKLINISPQQSTSTEEEILIGVAQPGGSIAKTAGSIIKPRNINPDHVADQKRQPITILEESSSICMSTPFQCVQVYQPAAGQADQLVKEFVGDLGTDHHFDDEGCSKLDWDDFILDMDLWTDFL